MSRTVDEINKEIQEKTELFTAALRPLAEELLFATHGVKVGAEVSDYNGNKIIVEEIKAVPRSRTVNPFLFTFTGTARKRVEMTTSEIMEPGEVVEND
jgi:hypothetical protein